MAKSKLGTRIVSINFGQGLDQKTDGKLTTKLTTADNVVIRKNGTIEKRLGFVADGTWSASANPVKVFPFKNGEFAITDWATDTQIANSDTSLNKLNRVMSPVGASWTTLQPFSFVTVRTQPLVSDIYSISYIDATLIGASATQEGALVATVLGAPATQTIATLDFSSEQMNQGFVVAQPNNRPITRMVSFSATSVTAWAASVNGGTTSIVFRSYDKTGTNLASVTAPVGINNGTAVLDIVPFANKFFFASTRSATQMLIGSFDPATSATSLTVIATSVTNPLAIAIATPDPATDRIRVFWSAPASITLGYACFSSTLSLIGSVVSFTHPIGSSLTGINNLAAVENVGATYASLFVQMNNVAGGVTISTTGGSTQQVGWMGDYSNTGTPLGASTAYSRTGMISASRFSSKPFIVHGQPHILVTAYSGYQSATYVVRRWGNHLSPVARINYGIAAPADDNIGFPMQAPMSNDGDVFYAAVRRASYFQSNAAQFFGVPAQIVAAYSVDAVRMNFSQSQPVPAVQLNDTTYLGGGFLTEYDGMGITEAGMLSYPSIVSITSVAGGALTAGQHGLVVVKEYTNQRGKTYQGTPSVPVTVTSALNDIISVTFTDWPSVRSLDNRGASGRYSIFRTQGNGSIYYRERSITVTVDSPEQATWSVSSSDTVLSGGDIIYTQGGLLPNWSPDSVESMCSHRGRLVCGDPTDQTILRYSKRITPGQGAQFAQAFIIQIPGTGRVSAVESLDSGLICFRQRAIFVITGDGPDDTGLNGSFSDGQLLFSDIGAIDQANVCRFSGGIIFKSLDKGWYLLSRDLQLQYVGADVESYNSKTVVSSQVVALAEATGTAEECRFLCSDGTLLTYNYFNGQWTTATLAGCTDAVQTGGRYVVVNPSSTAANARVFQQSLSTYTDAFSNTSITYQMTVETGWIKTSDVQGFQRVWGVAILGEAQGPGSIVTEIGYDYETSYNEAHTGTMSSFTAPNFTGGPVAVAQTQFVPARQKCMAIRFRIKDLPTAGGPGAVMKLTNISLECGTKSGVFKLPVAKEI